MNLPHCVRPCANCPWRKDSPAGEFPPERYEALRTTAGQPGDEAGFGAPIFACHKTEAGRDRACAGWLAVAGVEHLGIRLAVVLGRLPASALRPAGDWPELFASYDEMAERNGARADALCGQRRRVTKQSRPDAEDESGLDPAAQDRSNNCYSSVRISDTVKR